MMIPKPGFFKQTLLNSIKPRKSAWTQEEIQGLLQFYDLGAWQVVKELGGGNSDNILLQTPKGKKVLKKYCWSLPTIISEHSIIKRIVTADQGFPTPHVEINNNGCTYSLFAGRHYAIYEFINGFCYTDFFLPLRVRKKLVTQAALTLARFHQVMTGFIPEGRKLNGLMPDGNRLWRGTDWYLDILEKYLAKEEAGRKNELAQFIYDIQDELRQDLMATGRHYDHNLSLLPKRIVHADYSPHNILFTNQGVASVLDFGDSNLNLRVVDLARSLGTFAMSEGERIDECLFRIFVTTYNAQESLFEAELSAIPDMMLRRCCLNIIRPLFREMRAPVNFREKTLKKRLHFLQHLWKYAQAIKAQATKIEGLLFSSLA
jgi:Ser/Thr protein kinase RdoA (MazF antagonist)